MLLVFVVLIHSMAIKQHPFNCGYIVTVIVTFVVVLSDSRNEVLQDFLGANCVK